MRTVHETPDHLYPSALVADGDGGDAEEFVLPTDLTALTAEFDDDGNLTGGELRDLLDQAIAAFDAIHDAGVDTDSLGDLTTLAESIEAIRGEETRRSEERREQAEAAAALRDRVHASPEEPEAEADPETDPADEADPETDPADEADPVEPEAVTAATGPRRVSLARVRGRQPAPTPAPVETGPISLTAAADVPGHAGGANVGYDDLPAMFHGRARALGRVDGASAMVASVHTEYDHVVDNGATRDNMADIVEQATALPEEGLVAAGGWCAPNDRRWEFFSIEATGGLYNMPTLGIERGGLDWPISPSIADVVGAPWIWSEADDIAALDNDGGEDDVVKPCFRVPCGTWDSARLGMHGVCVTAGNLSTEAWPEQNRRYVDLVMAAHEQAMSARRIARVRALTTAVNIAATAGALAPLLSAIELQVMDYREQYRMSENAVLEAVFPVWIFGALRADFARRAGVEVQEITNAQIEGWFRSRGVEPQFVYGLQPIRTNAANIPLVWPANVQFMLYAAGTYLNGRGPRIDIGVTRDSRLNEVNDHMVLFTEEADLVAKVGYEGRTVTVPLITDGRTGAATYEATAPIA